MENKKLLCPMEIRCAWCDSHMTWGACQTPGKISHGICPECKKVVMAEIKAIRPAGAAKGAQKEGN